MRKDLGEFWDPRSFRATISTPNQGFAMGDEWEGEQVRNLTVDVQHGWFVPAVTAFDSDGNMRVLWEGRDRRDITAWDEIEEIADEWEIPEGDVRGTLPSGKPVIWSMRRVFADSGDPGMRPRIYLECARRGFYAIRGRNRDEPFQTGRGISPVSDVKTVTAKAPPEGEYCLEYQFQNSSITGHLIAMRDGGGRNGLPEIQLPSDVCATFLRELDNPYFDKATEKYKSGKGDHCFDALKMALAVAYVDGLMEIGG